jgi:hypothetical protein
MTMWRTIRFREQVMKDTQKCRSSCERTIEAATSRPQSTIQNCRVDVAEIRWQLSTGKANHETGRMRTAQPSAHCLEELKMYMNIILADVLGRQAFVDSDAPSRITQPGAGCNSLPWRNDVMHSGADNEWSAP